MNKALVILLILVAGCCLGGCGPTLYHVKVNGYTDPAAPAVVAPGSSFFVIENQQAQNRLLEKEIGGKINKLLNARGYRTVAYDRAQFYLFFSYGIGQQNPGSVAMPDYSYGFGIGGGTGGCGWWGGNYFFAAPFFAFYPTPENLYSRWLLINVVDGPYYREKGQFRTVWVGEARSIGTSGDLRTAVNYLLLADFRRFGLNTGKAVTVEIDQAAPQLEGLSK
jgi:hypothetical protein